jgi:heterodisulfide reductase subunit D
MWADFLPEPLEEKERAEVLYFVGCMSSFSPAIQQIPQSVATLLQRVGIDFMIMGEEEYCCGYPLLVGGMKEKISFLIEHNCKQIMDRGIKKIIFSCPSCYYTFSKFYPLQDIQLLHYVEYLLQLLDEGRLPLSSINKVVTYHDPCDLGRGLGIYDAPRVLIEAIPGLDFVEMPKSKEMALCCGGGGDLEIVDQPLSQKIGYTVIEEAKKVRVQALITACQQCKRTLQKAAEGIEVIDISELILLSLEGEDGDKRM